MNFIQIMELIILLWPLIKQFINAIEDEQRRETVADEVTTIAGNMLNGTVPVANALDISTALAKPFKIAA